MTPKTDPHALALALAPFLPAWRVAPQDPDCDHGASLLGPAGARLWLSCDWRGKVEIAGSFPLRPNGQTYCPPKEAYGRIAFDPKRAPQALARDIERRCIAVYLPAYEKALADVQADANARQQAARVAALLGERFRVEPGSQGTDGDIPNLPRGRRMLPDDRARLRGVWTHGLVSD